MTQSGNATPPAAGRDAPSRPVAERKPRKPKPPKPETPKRKQQIAILGGGPSGLSAAYHLTSCQYNPDWRDEYEVTVYQLGWRLGGKGASGRNAAMSDRIEEHGIHLFGNMYANSLHMLKACYDEVEPQTRSDPRSDPRIATQIEKAVLPSNFQFVTDYYDEKWHRLPSWLPENKELPWEGGAIARPGDIVEGMLEVMISILSGGKIPAAAWEDHPEDVSEPTLIERARGLLEDLSEPDLALLMKPLSWALQRLRRDARSFTLEQHGWVFDILHRVHERLGHWIGNRLRNFVEGSDSLRWMYVQFDLLIVCALGTFEDDLIEKGIDSVDGEDYREWLKRHGASDLTLDAALPQAIPNTCMQYPGGDSTRLPQMSAAAYLTFVLRQICARGQSAYFFQVSTGETVILPLYRALLARGVKFEFFTKVTDLVTGEDPATGEPCIEAIDCEIQAHVKGGNAYAPTRRLPDGQEVWPTRPLYDQLVEGDRLRDEGIDLESWWTPWQGDPQRLQRGQHFDQVIVAMPIECHKYVCRQAAAASPAWQTMVDHVQTTPTQALQIWLDPSVEELGWQAVPKTNRYIGPTFATPLVAFGDFTDGIQFERWPDDAQPKACIFFCGPFQAPDPMPPFSDHGFPARALEQVRGEAAQVLRGLSALLPQAHGDRFDQRSLDFDYLHVPPAEKARHGLQRFDLQYFRANIDPNERYTLSIPGTLQYRLKAWESGISNAVLCGDWIFTGFNIGSFEGAVMSGMLAAHTLTGSPKIEDILGYRFMRPNATGVGEPWLRRGAPAPAAR